MNFEEEEYLNYIAHQVIHENDDYDDNYDINNNDDTTNKNDDTTREVTSATTTTPTATTTTARRADVLLFEDPKRTFFPHQGQTSFFTDNSDLTFTE